MVKANLDNIWRVESRLEAEKALLVFNEKYQAKYPKAAKRLTKDGDELLAFYDSRRNIGSTSASFRGKCHRR